MRVFSFLHHRWVVKKGHLKLNKLHMRLCMYFNLIYLATSKKTQQPETDSSMEVHVSNNNEAFLCVCVLIFSCYISNISVLSGWLCCKNISFWLAKTSFQLAFADNQQLFWPLTWTWTQAWEEHGLSTIYACHCSSAFLGTQ